MLDSRLGQIGGLLVSAALAGGCFNSSGSGSSGDGSGDTEAADGSSGESMATTSADPSAGSGGQTGSEGADSTGASEACYADSTTGCTEVSWQDIESAIQFLYQFQSTYAGYSEQEALDVARELYDNGVPARSYLEIISSYETESGYRLHVVVTGTDGHPVPTLTPEDFSIVLDGEALEEAPLIETLESVDAAALELELDLSVVLDDSGSVQDCDANFVAQGLAYLLENLPPVYEMSLVKFTSTVDVAQPLTDDPQALIDAALNFCTDRGSTALWDGLSVGHGTLPHDGGFEAVVVFTDGLDNSSAVGLSDVIAQNVGTLTPVFVLGLGLPDLLSLSNLAMGTEGAFVYVNSGERILEGFETLTTFIRESYVIDLETSPETLELSVELDSGVVSDAL